MMQSFVRIALLRNSRGTSIAATSVALATPQPCCLR
jgi:hypothetical protein